METYGFCIDLVCSRIWSKGKILAFLLYADMGHRKVETSLNSNHRNVDNS